MAFLSFMFVVLHTGVLVGLCASADMGCLLTTRLTFTAKGYIKTTNHKPNVTCKYQNAPKKASGKTKQK